MGESLSQFGCVICLGSIVLVLTTTPSQHPFQSVLAAIAGLVIGTALIILGDFI